MSASSVDRETERKANDLYWDSQSSVNQIAEELELSKGTLYGLIRPLPSGLTCPDCNQEAVYPNRTAKERRMVACPSCGWEGDEVDADANGDGMVTLPDMPDTEDDVVAPPVHSQTQQRVMIGGALLGAAAGLALVFWARRR